MLFGQHAQQKRGMALGGAKGPPVEWEGIDKVVRSYFPEDYQRTLLLYRSSEALTLR
jgi:hypothetical protein